ncbi:MULTISPECIES: lipase maturation factor family protein [unclassified Cryobacterium]|uniref:lipase maturation factor family protein n=1 Tax=unclassified Cryobacterium TaxID=2649013 RepID=UPI00106A740F|nr:MULTISPECIES: lipase maturation factor family protein [unclassified Cryobacterium]TFC53468.1 lipase maturation factor family protein [Cryobacterium sp. TMB3-1-2]TFC69134.1 lipase maturation factor family protein [Cryobacterium sp. TMB3-15]TFC76067.1 lipase maturation factor family protein [Cryobacterium sp. TMB3-10]TFD43927.1 lipase maturation factor family protein [Cryobacterium sp. TMB3-12]
MDWFGTGDYDIAREVLQRGIAAIFLVAFASALAQFPALLGDNGLLPVRDFVARVPFGRSPSLFHWRYSDRLCRLVAWSGIVLAAAVVLGLPQLGPAWLVMIVFLLLFAGYLSIVNVGQTFYGFGWESLLVEAGFVVAFLGSADVATPLPVLYFLRWLVFRLEFGAGMIKLRGGREWRDLTALFYHHETQPMPNPVSWFVHHLPQWFHRGEVLANHTVQLIAPFLLFAPQPVASVAAGVIVLSQLWLVLTGNFAWLNWITIVLAAAAVDDAAFRWVGGLFVPALHAPESAAAAGEQPAWFVVVVLAVTLGLLVLSYWPARNLLRRRQLMNASFNPFHLVNAYGAFGTVTKERFEVVVEGSDSADPRDPTAWRAYEFRGKPGDVARVPGQFAPYHLRLDWLMWFLALGSRESRWFEVFLARLLQGDRATLRMLAHNPFAAAPPRYVRARVFLYRFSTPAERRAEHVWWVRSEVGTLVPPVRLPADTEDGSAS